MHGSNSGHLLQFEEIREVIGRYRTLVGMHWDLVQSAQEGLELIEQAKVRLARYKEEKDDEILQHNNELARLQLRFDHARSDVIVWVRCIVGSASPVPRCANR